MKQEEKNPRSKPWKVVCAFSENLLNTWGKGLQTHYTVTLSKISFSNINLQVLYHMELSSFSHFPPLKFLEKSLFPNPFWFYSLLPYLYLMVVQLLIYYLEHSKPFLTSTYILFLYLPTLINTRKIIAYRMMFCCFTFVYSIFHKLYVIIHLSIT